MTLSPVQTQPNSGIPAPVAGVTGGQGIASGTANVDPVDGSLNIHPASNVTQFAKGTVPQSLQVYEYKNSNSSYDRLSLITQIGGPFIIRGESAGPITPRQLWIASEDWIQINPGGGLLIQPGSNLVSIRNGAIGQQLQIYNTFTDNSNYERFILNWSGNFCYIGTDIAGSGQGRNVIMMAGLSFIFKTGTPLTDRWFLDVNGAFYPATTTAYDLGTPTNKVRDIVCGRNLVMTGSTGAVANRTKSGAPVDADIAAGVTDGMIVVDNTTNRIYARVGGVWRFAALT